MRVDVLMGWTAMQWAKAESYYNLCNPGTPITLKPMFRCAHEYRTMGAIDPNAHNQVMNRWRRNRMDEPGEINLYVPSMYRARPQ